MVVMLNQNIQNEEIRISRTKTIYGYRDSTLQDTSRFQREHTKYNPECNINYPLSVIVSLNYMKELNKSLVFKLRPSS